MKTNKWTGSVQQRHELIRDFATQVIVFPDGTFQAYRPHKGDHTNQFAKRLARAYGGKVINL